MQPYLRHAANAAHRWRFFSSGKGSGRGSVTGAVGAPPPAKFVPPSSTVETVPVSSSSPPQMNTFRSVFEHTSASGHPAAHLQKRRYKLRWDWHLRNFLISLLPSAALALFAIVYKSLNEEELEQIRALRQAEKRRVAGEANEKIESNNVSILGDLHALRSELEAVRAEVTLIRERAEAEKLETVAVDAKESEERKSGAPSVSDCAEGEKGPKDVQEGKSGDAATAPTAEKIAAKGK